MLTEPHGPYTLHVYDWSTDDRAVFEVVIEDEGEAVFWQSGFASEAEAVEVARRKILEAEF